MHFSTLLLLEIRAPDHVWSMIKQFWDINHMNAKPESWGVGKWIAKTRESYGTHSFLWSTTYLCGGSEP
jgi:hypothetical protein